MKQYEFKAVAELDRVLVAMAGGAKKIKIVIPPEVEMDDAEAEEFVEQGNPALWTADLEDSTARHYLQQLQDGTPEWTQIGRSVIARWLREDLPIRWLLDQIPLIDVAREVALPDVSGRDFLRCFYDLCNLTSDQFRHIREMSEMRARGQGTGNPKYDKRVERTHDDPAQIAALRRRLDLMIAVMAR